MSFEERVAIPIYGTWLLLSVSEDAVKARKQHKEFGPFGGGKYANAIASAQDGDFGLFFRNARLTHGVVGHEIFHITHRVMEFHGIHFDLDNQEAHAYLNGWISQWVYYQFGQHKVRLW